MARQSPHAQARWYGEMLELSWKPRSTFLKGFLTPEECEALIALARPSPCAHIQKPT